MRGTPPGRPETRPPRRRPGRHAGGPAATNTTSSSYVAASRSSSARACSAVPITHRAAIYSTSSRCASGIEACTSS
ncbi:hypothetical protein, partial [Nocardioides sp. SYSU DS0663]|uniref:hypothetical protein n=1 Tax=Nocardioides sp. SYSU DS0663 TaxID=3416445 RepID=UPI003F4CA9F9